MSSEGVLVIVPLYQRIKDFVTTHIASGQWPVAHRIPSEHELVKKFGVSRMTVNRAIRELTAEGMLTRIQGAGTFVSSFKPASTMVAIRNIAEEIRERGARHSCDVQLVRSEKPGAHITEEFNLPEGSLLFHSILVHKEDNLPIQVEDRYVNPALAPEYLQIDFSSTTPNQYLMKVAPLQEAEFFIEAVIPNGTIRNLLQMTIGDPCLLQIRRTRSLNQVASTAHLFHPGSRYRLSSHYKPGSVDNIHKK